MSEEADRDSKTEPATEKKKRDSIDKGRTPSSREAIQFASMLGVLLATMFILEGATGRLTIVLGNLMELSGELSLRNGADAVLLFQALGIELARFLLPVVLFFAFAPVIASMLQKDRKGVV